MDRPRIGLLTLVLVGCTGNTSPEPTAPSAAPASGGQRTAADVEAAGAASVDALLGFWAEYWAVVGDARTQRYVFLPDGRFGWLAAPDDAQPVMRRSGRWALEGDVLVLSETARVERGCGPGPCAAEPKTITQAPPIERRLELGACPDNAEARELDARYACRSIEGRAFWRRAGADADDPAPFFE